jgi:hypothetical protein
MEYPLLKTAEDGVWLLRNALPFPTQITDIDTSKTGSVYFRWRSQRYKLGLAGCFVERSDGCILTGDDCSILMGTLLHRILKIWRTGKWNDIIKDSIDVDKRPPCTVSATVNFNKDVVPYQKCPVCGGTGKVYDGIFDVTNYTDGLIECRVCNGNGVIPMCVLPSVKI